MATLYTASVAFWSVFTIFCSFLFPLQAGAFLPTATTPSSHLSSELFSTSPDDLSNESPEEYAERMKLVRKIQASFYKDEEIPLVDVDGDNTLTNVPLFRVQWTELIGFQNILNIHEPHYTHMFRRVIQGPKPWRFGHVYLPEGSKNLNNPTYRYDNPNNKASKVGTLMQISDVMEMEDGRFGLIVQAIERFEIANVTQHEPYTLATVRLKPDDEFYSDSTSWTTLAELEKWYEWENCPTKYSDCDDQGRLQVSPLVNYNSNFFADEISLGASADNPGVATDNRLVAELEYKVWVALDELLAVLGEASGMRVPIPSQLLGLLPNELPIGMESWPKDFRVETVAQELQTRNANVGTYTKSPFLRVSENLSYPPLRRARRFSFVVWILLDSILGLLGPKAVPNKQGLLECTSIAERLSAAYEQLDQINGVLRQKRR